MAAWIGVDLDGTLAHFDHFRGWDHIGDPVPEMLARVRGWLAEGRDVRIFTARVATVGSDDGSHVETSRASINEWTILHLGVLLPITCCKDVECVELWDDIAVGVVKNTGRPAAF